MPPLISLKRARIAFLEGELQYCWKTIAGLQKDIQEYTSSHGWRLLNRYYRVRNYLLPRGSGRHRVAATLAHGLFASTKFVKNALVSLWSKDHAYASWIRRHEPGSRELSLQRQAKFSYEPLVSIVVPTYNTPAPILEEMIQSVIAQTYGRWQLCIADGSDQSAVKGVLEEYARKEPRIRLRWLTENGGIAANSNAGLALAEGDFVAFLDHDDTLAPFALYEMVKTINARPDADLLYSDEDKIDESGRRRFDPHFKPDWSPDTLRSYNYVCHLAVFRHELLQQIGGFRSGFDGSQDYDLILRPPKRPRRSFMFRKFCITGALRGSVASDHSAKSYAYVAARKALAEHLERIGLDGTIEQVDKRSAYRVRYSLATQPLISIIIPTQDHAATLRTCIESLDKTSYQNYEIILIENHSAEPQTFALYEELKKRPNLKLLTWTQDFNYATINNFAAEQAARRDPVVPQQRHRSD